jgi:small GTP-binding protein
MIRTSNSNRNFGNDIKIIVVGNSNAGKTSFVNKWIKNIFIDNYKATILSEFNSKIYEKNDKIYRVQIWDIAGN